MLQHLIYGNNVNIGQEGNFVYEPKTFQSFSYLDV